MLKILPGLAVAATLLGASGSSAADKIDASYKFYWKGLLVSQVETSAVIDDENYDLSIDFRMRGVAKLFANGRSAARVIGRMDGGAPVPAVFEADGRWDGDDYAQIMRFDPSGLLVEQELDWPEEWLEDNKREPVPEDMRRGPDPASLVVKLISTPLERAINAGPMVERTFDGDTVFDYDISCLPDPVILEKSGKSPFSGEAYECSFGGTLVAGKRILNEKQQKKADKRRRKVEKKKAKGTYEEPTPPKLWVQVFEDGAYVIPVRAEVSSDMGRVQMYLSALELTKLSDTLETASGEDREPVMANKTGTLE